MLAPGMKKFLTHKREGFVQVEIPGNEELMAESVDKLVENFERECPWITGISNRSPDERGRKADSAFFGSFAEVINTEGLSPVERRIMGSDLVLLHYLLVDNSESIDTAYGEYLKKLGKSASEISFDDEVNIKAVIAEEFLENQRNKNGEAELFAKYPDAPTVGFEFEFAEMVGMVSELFKIFDTNIQKLETEMLTLRGSDYLAKNAELQLVVSQRDTYSRLLPQNIYAITADGRFIDQGDTATNLTVLSSVVPTRVETLAGLGSHHEVPEKSLRELVSEPTMTPSAALRELIILRKAGLLTGMLTVHETVAGIEITPDRLDFMEARALLNAADYDGGNEEINAKAVLDAKDFADLLLGRMLSDIEIAALKEGKILPETLDDLLKFNVQLQGERVIKFSVTDGEDVLIPFHRNRRIQRGREESVLRPFPNESLPDTALECRSFDGFDLSKTQDFSNLVRRSKFLWLAAWGEKDNVIPEENRTDVEEAVAASWRSLLYEWSQLGKKFGISHPERDHMYFSTAEAQNDGQYNYVNYLNKIALTSIGQSELRSESRRLISEYNARTKEILGIR